MAWPPVCSSLGVGHTVSTWQLRMCNGGFTLMKYHDESAAFSSLKNSGPFKGISGVVGCDYHIQLKPTTPEMPFNGPEFFSDEKAEFSS